MALQGNIIAGENELMNWDVFLQTQAAVGEHFVRLLGYFREDGPKSVAAIELALQQKSSGPIVLPAHTLKGEAAQFGAEKLSLLAEEIEVAARHYVEIQQDPAELVEQIAQLRPLFEASLAAIDEQISPLVKREPASLTPNIVGFGRRSV